MYVYTVNMVTIFVVAEKHKGAQQFFMSGPEEYQPGVSIFKGRKIQVWLKTKRKCMPSKLRDMPDTALPDTG